MLRPEDVDIVAINKSEVRWEIEDRIDSNYGVKMDERGYHAPGSAERGFIEARDDVVVIFALAEYYYYGAECAEEEAVRHHAKVVDLSNEIVEWRGLVSMLAEGEDAGDMTTEEFVYKYGRAVAARERCAKAGYDIVLEFWEEQCRRLYSIVVRSGAYKASSKNAELKDSYRPFYEAGLAGETMTFP